MSADSEGKPQIVLHLVSDLKEGGIQSQLRLVCSHYDRNRFIPLVCCIQEREPIGLEIEREGTEVIALSRKTLQPDPYTLLRIYRILKERGVHILRSHDFAANFYGSLASLFAKTPLRILSVHRMYGDRVMRMKRRHREVILGLLANSSNGIVAVSESVKSDLLRRYRTPPEKVRVIYNGIDPAEFQGEVKKEELKPALSLPPQSRVIGTIGRMAPEKGQIYLLEAFAGLQQRVNNLRLLIVGDGPLRADLQQKAEALGVGQEVCFAGARRDIYPLLSIMDLFALPSLSEGLSGVLLEAMAAGRPVVASDIPPLREIITSADLGVLVPPRDAKSLEHGLEQILKDGPRAERMGRLAREYVTSAFPIQRTVSQYQDLFTEMQDLRRQPN